MDLIWNGNFQSLFLSPLIGAVMGFILTYLLTPPSDRPASVNIAYSQVVRIFHTEVHHHYHGSKSEDGEAFWFGLILMVVSAWLYLNYGQTVLAVLTLTDPLIFIQMYHIAPRGHTVCRWMFDLRT